MKMTSRQDKRSFRQSLAALCLGLCALPTLVQAEWVGDARPKMGTEVSVYLWHEDDGAAREAVDAVFDEMDRINALMSTYVEDSRISLVNREAAGRWVDAGEELFALVMRSLEISAMTDGAFDITFDSVGQHYDFRARQRPGTKEIEAAIDAIDYRLVESDAERHALRFAREGVRINLGGIAKGYAVERGVRILRQHGIVSARVTAGGDTRLLGSRRGQPWVVGVRDPDREDRINIRLPLEDEAISTSGDYERFFIEDGTRYHHILSPATGEPAEGVRSATVVGPDAVTTDALSTSVFVMGVDAGLRLIGRLPEYEAIVIDADGQLFYSDGFAPPD